MQKKEIYSSNRFDVFHLNISKFPVIVKSLRDFQHLNSGKVKAKSTMVLSFPV